MGDSRQPETNGFDEFTPLLTGSGESPDSESQHQSRKVTPLPKAQLATVCIIRIMDPIAFTQIFPYINEFIAFLRLTDDPTKVGFYSGLVESSFAITQFFSIYQWSRLSDRMGRKPVVMIGTFGVAVSTMYFGLSNSLFDLLFSRCIAGVFAGTVAVIQSVLGEITDSTNQAAAFPMYGLVWPIGSITGPLIGGALSNPATKYGVFFQDSIFGRHPYFLPCLVSGLLSFSGVILAYSCLKETLASKVEEMDHRRGEDEPLSRESSEASNQTGLKELLSIPILRALSISAFALNFNATAFDVLFVLFCYTPIQKGGLAFEPSTIGYALSSSGLISATMQIFLMPVILKRYEGARIYNIATAAWPVAFAVLPILNVIARHGSNHSTGLLDQTWNVVLWIGVGVVLAISKIGGLAYSLSLILTKNNVPNLSVLGTANGVMSCAMSLARIISPALASSAFALSEEHHLLGGYLWALFMASISLCACTLGRNISRHSRSTLNYD